MNKKILLLILLILVFLAGVFLGRVVFTGRAVENIASNYSWTKAVCNSENECMDVLVTCEDGKAISIEPISVVVRYDKNWEDPRDIDKLC